jgi:hypothetical protein
MQIGTECGNKVARKVTLTPLIKPASAIAKCENLSARRYGMHFKNVWLGFMSKMPRWKSGDCVELYVRRWKRWALSGVMEVSGAFEWPDLESLRYSLSCNEGYCQQHR